MLIDSHHHLWDLASVSYPWLEARGVKRFFGDPAPIQKNYLADNFHADWDGVPIDGSVHIQVGAAAGQEVAETRWLDAHARQSGLPSAIVGFCDLRSPDLEATLDSHLAASSLFKGVRQIVSRHRDEDTATEGLAILEHPHFLRGLRVLEARRLSFDLQLTPPLLHQAAEIFSQVPHLPVALCHAGSPWDQDAQGLQDWIDGLETFSQLPEAVCKISGLGMFNPDWTRATLAPIVEGVVQTFGPDRVMWGSNFPVDKLYRNYRSLFETVQDIVPSQMHTAVFGTVAAKFYRLSATR